jgi:effector-binding domain-containing protein
MQSVMGPAIGEVMAAVAAAGMTPRGPVFAHHLTLSDSHFDFEVGVPTPGPIAATGRVKASELPGGRVAQAVYYGPYEGLYAAWSEFGEWMKSQGLRGRGDIWECYAAGPESSDDPATWRTELNLPLV